MEGFSDMMSSFTSPGGGLSKLLPAILAGTGIMGTVGNIKGNATKNAVLQQQMDLTKRYANMTPAQVSGGISSLEAPLSKDLTNSVGNTVQGQLAERGLSQAPGIFASSLGQGLAPYQLQEQQLAQDAFFKQLGLPIQARPSPFGPFPNQTNTSAIWQNFMKTMQPPGGGSPATPIGSNPNDLLNLFMGNGGMPQLSGSNFTMPYTDVSNPGLTTPLPTDPGFSASI
jgi:hypothetical protein